MGRRCPHCPIFTTPNDKPSGRMSVRWCQDSRRSTDVATTRAGTSGGRRHEPGRCQRWRSLGKSVRIPTNPGPMDMWKPALTAPTCRRTACDLWTNLMDSPWTAHAAHRLTTGVDHRLPRLSHMTTGPQPATKLRQNLKASEASIQIVVTTSVEFLLPSGNAWIFVSRSEFSRGSA